MSYSITDSDPEYVSAGPSASRLFDRSALYTLAHNIQVGAALCEAHEAGQSPIAMYWFPGCGQQLLAPHRVPR